MSRHQAFRELQTTVERQLTQARAARERAELASAVAWLIVVTIGACAVFIPLLLAL